MCFHVEDLVHLKILYNFQLEETYIISLNNIIHLGSLFSLMIWLDSVAFRKSILEVQSNAMHNQLSFFLLLITNNIAILIVLPSLLTYFVSKYWDSSVGIATG
jgi:Na+-translocating ferredoxin:NAD+ oxidoreductase RnfA subunit